MKRLSIILALLVAACQPSPEEMRAYYMAEGDRLEEATKNVRKAYTFEAFIANPEYRHTRDMWRGAALNGYAPANSYVTSILIKVPNTSL